jgi:hypothetical protein
MKKLFSLIVIAGVALAIIPAEADQKPSVSCTDWAPVNPTNPNTAYYMICDNNGQITVHFKDCYYCPDPDDTP